MMDGTPAAEPTLDLDYQLADNPVSYTHLDVYKRQARLRQQRHAAGARQHRVLAQVQPGMRPLGAERARSQQLSLIHI